MKLTKAIEALTNGNHNLGRNISSLKLERGRLDETIKKAEREWSARGDLLTAMKGVQETMPKDETIDFVVPGEYE